MEKKEFLNSFVEQVDIYEQEQPDGKFLEGSNTGWVIQTLCIGLSLYGAELFQVTSMDSGLKSRLEFCLAQFR